jgi:hypothetical protein
MLLGLPHEMLARAEADLQPHAVGRQSAAEQLGEIDLLRLGRQGKGEARQAACRAATAARP